MADRTYRLILARHAKSDWDDPALEDHDRPLNPRGRRAAGALGTWLAQKGYLPQEVFCSSALRTRQTWEGAAAAIGTPAAEAVLLLEPVLYHATPDRMLAVLRGARAGVVMMLGHNPGIAAFAQRLPAQAVAHPAFGRYPTAATLVVDFEIGGWDELRPGNGRTVDFFTPRDAGPG